MHPALHHTGLPSHPELLWRGVSSWLCMWMQLAVVVGGACDMQLATVMGSSAMVRVAGLAAAAEAGLRAPLPVADQS